MAPRGSSNAAIRQFFERLQAAAQQLDVDAVNRLCQRIWAHIEARQSVIVMGNGGSAASASHFVTDLFKILGGSRHQGAQFLRCLNDSTSLITAIANDEGFDNLFAYQLRALATPGDLIIVITTTGLSRNILAALHWAKAHCIDTFGLLGGSGGEAKDVVQDYILVPSSRPYEIEAVHLMICHVVAALIWEHLAQG